MQTHSRYLAGQLEFFDQGTQERLTRFTPVQYVEDFLGAWVTIPAAGSAESGCDWVAKVVKTGGSPAAAISANAANGVVSCALDNTSEKQEAGVYMDDQRQFSLEQKLVVEMRLKVSVLPTLVAEAVWGLIGDWADGLDNATYSAFFTADGSGEVFCEMDDNVTDRSTTSGITVVATAWHTYRIEAPTVGDVRYYIDGVHVATGTTFAYAATGANAILQPYFGVYKASGAGVGTILCDFVKCWQERS